MSFVTRVLAGWSVGFIAGVLPAGAQTRFAEPAGVVDVAEYRTPDQCLAAVARMLASKEDRLPIHRDTAGRA